MSTMPRPRPPHLHRQVTRHGKTVWYVRVGKGRRIRIRATFGTPEFDVEYHAAITARLRPSLKGAPSAGTLAWLIERYRETPAWRDLSLATRQQRETILAHVIKSAGSQPFAQITRAIIIAGRDRRQATPAQARHFLETMRGLFRWATDAQLVKANPTAGVADPARPKNAGIPVWSEEQVAAYERRWPIGTRQRVWLDVLLYTGLRRGDAVRLGRQHVRNGAATIRTEKTNTEVTLPILPVLAETLRAGPCGDLTFIVGANGKPLDKRSFGNQFRKACRAAGVQRSAHGLRKVAATRAANAGATVAELEAIFGWTGGRMASLYTRAADRRQLAQRAMHKLANDERTSIPSPSGKVRASDGKDE
jgi:integrase